MGEVQLRGELALEPVEHAIRRAACQSRVAGVCAGKLETAEGEETP